MRDLVPVDDTLALRVPSVVALEADAPDTSELFAFMAEAELRFETLRMRIVDRTLTARGERLETVEVALRHPGWARVVRRRDDSGLSTDYDVWIADGRVVKTYDARSQTASVRPFTPQVRGATSTDLPSFSRVWVPRTRLPNDSLADTFIHPRGLVRNVLGTGPLTQLGSVTLAGHREALVVRVDHPRTSHLLTDRPDRWLEIAVDRMTGLVLRLREQVGARTTRHAEVTQLELDPVLDDDVFALHISSDVRMLY
ncbi:MAG: hypothetical protein ACR2LP_06370 [Candidatus Limnocylindrales bacterium]